MSTFNFFGITFDTADFEANGGFGYWLTQQVVDGASYPLLFALMVAATLDVSAERTAADASAAAAASDAADAAAAAAAAVPAAVTATAARDEAVAAAASAHGLRVATVGGTADAITLTCTPPVTALDRPVMVQFRPSGANTGAVTVNADGLGPVALTWADGTALAAGDLAASDEVLVASDGAAWRLLTRRLVIGATVQPYSAATAVTDQPQTFTAAVRGTITVLADGATITPDLSLSNDFTVTLGGSRTVANPTNIVVGQPGQIAIVQDGTGSRALAWGSYWDWEGGAPPDLSTAPGAIDVVSYWVRSATSIVASLAVRGAA